MFDGGRIRFRFWDTELKDFRSIQTIGRCFVSGQWHYLRFRYKYKNSSGYSLDTNGGWEPDQRWIFRASTGNNFVRDFRDGLWVWCLEGDEPAHPLLKVPGAHNAWGLVRLPGANFRGYSRHLGNVGLMRDNPWIAPEEGETGYSSNVTGYTNKPVACFEAELTDNSGGIHTFSMPGSTEDIYLPRWFSLNRDEPYEGDSRTQLNQSDNNRVQDLGTNGTGVIDDAAILLYVFGQTTTEFTPARIFAIRSIGADVGDSSNEQFGANNISFEAVLTASLGGDGGSSLSVSATKYVVAFALPNGSNQSTAATGNAKPLPTLLEHGPNPVGVNDRPDSKSKVVRIGGPQNPDLDTKGVTGLRARIGDVGFSVYSLASSTSQVYTADQMNGDFHFHGPTDTRIGSLPLLIFDDNDNGSPTDYADVAAAAFNPAPAVFSARHFSDDRFEVAIKSGLSAGNEEGFLPNGVLREASDRVQASGRHKLRVTFYDPDQGVESAPSDEQLVELEGTGEDDFILGERSLQVTGVPVSSDRLRRRIWRRVYKTLQDGEVFFRAAEIQDNSTSSVRLEPSTTELLAGAELDLFFDSPPACRYLKASENRLVFGALTEAPTAISWSDAFLPWKVPGTNREVLESAEGNAITALAYLSGQLFAFKPDSIFAFDVGDTFARIQRLQSNTGAVSHFTVREIEDGVLFVAEKGVYSFDGSARIVYLSPAIETSFQTLDSFGLRDSSAAYLRSRNQYLYTGRTDIRGEQDLLYTCEVPDSPLTQNQGVVWSKQQHPVGFSFITSVDDPGTDELIVVGGTNAGMAVRFNDNTGARGHRIGTLYGDSTPTASGAVSSGLLSLSGSPSLDTGGDGLAGTPFAVVRTTSSVPSLVTEGIVFSNTATQIRVLHPGDMSAIANGDVVHLGGWSTEFESKWFDWYGLTRRARFQYIEFVFASEASGSFKLEIFKDFSASAFTTKVIAMDDGYARQSIDIRPRFMKFKISRTGVNLPLEIYSIGLRFKRASQR